MNAHTKTLMLQMFRALKEIAEGSSPDLTLRQVLVLLSVGASGLPMTQQQLADKHDLSKSTLSKIIANLAGMTGDVRRGSGLGLLSVDLDPSDLRNRLVSLSPQGDKLMARAVKAGFRE